MDVLVVCSCFRIMHKSSTQHVPALWQNHTSQLFMGFVLNLFYNIITIRHWNSARAKLNICFILGGFFFSACLIHRHLCFRKLTSLTERHVEALFGGFNDVSVEKFTHRSDVCFYTCMTTDLCHAKSYVNSCKPRMHMGVTVCVYMCDIYSWIILHISLCF